MLRYMLTVRYEFHHFLVDIENYTMRNGVTNSSTVSLSAAYLFFLMVEDKYIFKRLCTPTLCTSFMKISLSAVGNEPFEISLLGMRMVESAIRNLEPDSGRHSAQTVHKKVHS